jgi:hypothetical protein
MARPFFGGKAPGPQSAIDAMDEKRLIGRSVRNRNKSPRLRVEPGIS